MNTWNYKFLDIPQPPIEFVNLARSANIKLYGPLNRTNHYVGHSVDPLQTLKNGKSSGINVATPRYDVPLEFRQWIIENISPDVAETSISISQPSKDGALGPHTDRSRRYVLIYVVHPGGSRVRTCFWQEHGFPKIRDEFVGLKDEIALPNDYNSLDLLEEADFGVNRWVLLNSKVLHSVEHINGVRISFQFSFGPDISSLEKFFT